MSDRILEVISKLSVELLQTVDLRQRYKVIIEKAAEIAGVNFGTIFLYKEGFLERVYSTVPSQRRARPRKRGYAFEAFISGEIQIVTPKMLEKAHKSLYDKGVKSLILIPLVSSNKKIGVVSLQSENLNVLQTHQLRALKILGSIASLSIKNSFFFDETRKSLEARDLFISLASHEIRTPLTTIAAYTALISKKVNSKKMPSINTIEIVSSEIERLKNIVNDLLEFDRIISGKFRYRWRELNILTVIKKSVINFKSANPQYKVVVENNLPRELRVIQGDPEKLQQAFSNILNNAAKFSSSYTPILIQLEKIEEKVSISFSDYGKGMRKKDQEKVFNEFYKGESQKQGMGLGLYLVRRIIEKHKGSIVIDSKINKGTKIEIVIPVSLYG